MCPLLNHHPRNDDDKEERLEWSQLGSMKVDEDKIVMRVTHTELDGCFVFRLQPNRTWAFKVCSSNLYLPGQWTYWICAATGGWQFVFAFLSTRAPDPEWGKWNGNVCLWHFVSLWTWFGYYDGLLFAPNFRYPVGCLKSAPHVQLFTNSQLNSAYIFAMGQLALLILAALINPTTNCINFLAISATPLILLSSSNYGVHNGKLWATPSNVITRKWMART